MSALDRQLDAALDALVVDPARVAAMNRRFNAVMRRACLLGAVAAVLTLFVLLVIGSL